MEKYFNAVIPMLTPHRKAFSVYWNVPTQGCMEHYDVNVDVSRYGMITNVYDGWTGANITIFPHPGLYPSVTENGTILNGGIPQNVNLTKHLQQIHYDIKSKIPADDFHGLGIIDYEAWRPLWERNWDEKEIYQKLSIDLVKKNHPEWPYNKIIEKAKRAFEAQSRKFMESTIKLAENLRAKGSWGFYHYPYCFNHHGKSTCSDETMTLNNRIMWLFKASTALYPSAYLETSYNSTANYNHVHGEVIEAKRVQHLLADNGTFLPIYLYSKFRYSNGEYYTKGDLLSSLSQASELGVDGVVLWDDHHLSETKAACTRVKYYLNTLLGPFVENLVQKT